MQLGEEFGTNCVAATECCNCNSAFRSLASAFHVFLALKSQTAMQSAGMPLVDRSALSDLSTLLGVEFVRLLQASLL